MEKQFALYYSKEENYILINFFDELDNGCELLMIYFNFKDQFF